MVVILADDLGFSDLGSYGGDIDTPNLDRLARSGLRLSNFYNTAKCSPSRASLLTGLHPHQTGIGILVKDQRPWGYPGTLNDRCVTMAEVLGAHGYRSHLSGKWHLTGNFNEPDGAWPTERGFDGFFGTIAGAGSYFAPATLTRDEEPVPESSLPDDWFYTDAISDATSSFISRHCEDSPDKPFFCYVAYTAPHWPLHAKEEDVDRYRGRFDAGWDALRSTRLDRLISQGILAPDCGLSGRDPLAEPWDEASHKQWQARRMEVYAAQVTRMDAGIGQIVHTLERQGQLDNTIVIFLSDNGGSAESQPVGIIDDAMAQRLPALNRRTRSGEPIQRGDSPAISPGPENTWASYGRAWSNLSNAPFREHKSFVHEGGIAAPFIAHWPDGIRDGGVVRDTPHQLTDLMPTILEAAGITYPHSLLGRDLLPLEGVSMLPTWHGLTHESSGSRMLFWEHLGNAAARYGAWKLVRTYPGDWELYNLEQDRSELCDLASQYPDVVNDLRTAYEQWAARCGVIPFDQLQPHLA
ncbi:arylsulfatase [Ruania rhizosphaerae]|uniref:arylsulfatase n=1 Tax=Ruania rhizosphaerae TaxID=1840413 RepID=UPI001F366C12|nr:arylsulfatase [Ruania rhizosphaerae]